MAEQTGLEKFRKLDAKMEKVIDKLEKVMGENNGVLPQKYLEKAHQLKNVLEDLNSKATQYKI